MTQTVFKRWLPLVVSLTLSGLSVANGQSSTALEQSTSDGRLLNVTIPEFDDGIPDDPSVYREQQIFPRIRDIESRLLPFQLRETLVNTGQWGAVRVTATPETAPEVEIKGRILRSDGDTLELKITVVDATGKRWFDKVFSATASELGSATRAGAPEFQDLYDSIARELTASRDGPEAGAVSTIKAASLMRYAAALAPTAFAGFIEKTDDGRWRALRLPARNDPMLLRIERIRNTEFLITDSVDAKYRELNDELARTYRVWRRYRRKLREYEAEDQRFGAAKPAAAERGSWESIKHQYDAYKYNRITVQEQDRLAVAFNNEVGTTVDAMEERVAELEGWVQQGYVEWNRLLEELSEVESYLLENPQSDVNTGQ